MAPEPMIDTRYVNKTSWQEQDRKSQNQYKNITRIIIDYLEQRIQLLVSA